MRISNYGLRNKHMISLSGYQSIREQHTRGSTYQELTVIPLSSSSNKGGFTGYSGVPISGVLMSGYADMRFGHFM